MEFSRYDKRTGVTTTYGHIYWRPFIVHVLGRTIIGKRHLDVPRHWDVTRFWLVLWALALVAATLVTALAWMGLFG